MGNKSNVWRLLYSLTFLLIIIIVHYDVPELMYKKITSEQQITIEIAKKYPFIDATRVDSSIIQIYCESDEYEKGSIGQCCVYARRGEIVYIALPRHCMPTSTTTRIDFTTIAGKKLDMSYVLGYEKTNQDAAMLVVLDNTKKDQRIPSLSERRLLAKEIFYGDTVIVQTPFNARKLQKKYGIMIDDRSAAFDPYRCETGDSGSLLVSRLGVAGIVTSVKSNSNVAFYVPIAVFEELYIYATK